MRVDAVILTNTADIGYYGLTMRTINTMRSSSPGVDFMITVVESNGGDEERFFIYPGCRVVRPKPPFNYNRFMNEGVSGFASDHVLMCNNDIRFAELSVSRLVAAMAEHGLDSACPLEPNWHRFHFSEAELSAPVIKGYRVMHEMVGWCVCATRRALEAIGPLDEAFDYYYQDNDYVMSVRAAGLSHGLVTGSHVFHELSSSQRLMSSGVDETSARLKSAYESKWLTRSSAS